MNSRKTTCFALLLAAAGLAGGRAVVAAEMCDYPIKNASFADAKATGGLWFDRLETNRVSTLATDWAKCAETPRIADRKSTRLNSSHPTTSRMPSSA